MRPLLAMLLLVGAPLTVQAEPERVGVFVGSNGAPPGLTPLEHAEADADRMRRVFVDLGGLAASDAYLLQSPSADDILELIHTVGGPKKMLIFYYSGHADDRALLLDGSQLPLSELSRALKDSGAQLSLHLVDACRSGALARRKGASLGAPFVVDATQTSEGKVVITSSAEWEDSHESDRMGGSFFTLHMATGLRGAADEDGDGRVTLFEAYRYVYGRTVETTLASRGGVQHPTFAYDLSGRGEVVLTWPARSGGTLVFSDGDYVVIEAHSGRVAAEISTSHARVNLPLGEYRVRKRTRSEVLSGRVRIAQGQTQLADASLTEREAHARLVRKGGPKDPDLAHTLRITGGVRGRVADGLGASAMFRLGYEATLPWFSVMGFASLTVPSGFDTPRLRYNTQELGLGALVSRSVDFRWVTLRGGLLAEILRLSQSEVSQQEPQRNTLGGALGVHAGIETPPFFGDFVASLAGEAAVYVYRGSAADREPSGPGELLTRPAYRALMSLGYEF